MSTVKEIQTAIPNLPREEVEQIRQWIDDYLEDQLELSDEVKAKLLDGTFVIYKGPIKDNTGKTVIPEGTARPQTDIELEKMNYLVEGVIGKLPS